MLWDACANMRFSALVTSILIGGLGSCVAASGHEALIRSHLSVSSAGQLQHSEQPKDEGTAKVKEAPALKRAETAKVAVIKEETNAIKKTAKEVDSKVAVQKKEKTVGDQQPAEEAYQYTYCNAWADTGCTGDYFPSLYATESECRLPENPGTVPVCSKDVCCTKKVFLGLGKCEGAQETDWVPDVQSLEACQTMMHTAGITFWAYAADTKRCWNHNSVNENSECQTSAACCQCTNCQMQTSSVLGNWKFYRFMWADCPSHITCPTSGGGNQAR